MQAHLSLLQKAQSGAINSDSVAEMPEFETYGRLFLTVRNYATEHGLSTIIHKHSKAKIKNMAAFKVIGPMGLGLGFNKQGYYAAVATGTGVLPFLDLVALMVRQKLAQVDEDDRLSDDFKFELLYITRQGEEIAL